MKRKIPWVTEKQTTYASSRLYQKCKLINPMYARLVLEHLLVKASHLQNEILKKQLKYKNNKVEMYF